MLNRTTSLKDVVRFVLRSETISLNFTPESRIAETNIEDDCRYAITVLG